MPVSQFRYNGAVIRRYLRDTGTVLGAPATVKEVITDGTADEDIGGDRSNGDP